MSTFGIDYQATLTLLALRGGSPGSKRLTYVGDGTRTLIPNIALASGAWGSAALSAEPGDTTYRGMPGEAGAWLEEPGSSLLWRGLAGRLRHFLGGVAPTGENGYQCVVALSAAEPALAAESMRQRAGGAGLPHIDCIRAAEALLCQWLAEEGAAPKSPRTVAVVVCSDSLTSVAAFHLEPAPRGQWRLFPSDTELVLAAGHCSWAGRVLSEVRDRRSESHIAAALRDEIALNEATLAFASRLSAADPHKAVEWQGPFREHAFTNLRIAPAECRSWPEVALLHNQLPSMVRQVAAGFSGGAAPDAVVLGGIGALWPFARDALGSLGGVATASHAEHALARGAAWWPVYRENFADGVPERRALAGAADPGASPPAEEPGPDTPPVHPSLLPPWER
jgi:hypothetical protein